MDGAELAAGVHLLWTVDTALGFPVGGYDVARREHEPPEWLCLPFDQAGLPDPGATTWTWDAFTITVTPGPVRLDKACAEAPGLALPGARTLTVGHSPPGIAVRATGLGAPPLVEVAGPGALLARASATDGWSVELWAPDITEIRITGDDLVVCTLCLGQAVPDGGWRQLTEHPILLPVVPEGTRNLPGLIQDSEHTLAMARSRLPAGLPKATADRLAAAFADEPRELVELLLRAGPAAPLPAAASAADGARSAPRLDVAAAAVLALAALDPDLARMLGLLWHDPVRTGRWDYRVVAHYGPVPHPADSIRFDGLPPGQVRPGSVAVGGLTVVGSAGLAVLAAPVALRVEPPLPGTRAGLLLPPDVRSVRLRLTSTGAGDGVVFAGRRGDRAVVTVTGDGNPVVIEDAGGLDAVTWDTGPLDLVEVELSDTPGMVGDLAAYTWNVTATERIPVRSPAIADIGADAAVRPPTPDGRLPRCAGVVGADWHLPDVRDAGQPVRVLVGRSAPATSEDAAANGPFTVVNAARPAPAAADEPAGAWPGPDVPRRWIQPVEDAGWYAVRVGGIDSFGRLGPWSETRTVRVGAAPEPGVPDAVTARYLDPDDPTLTDSDRALSDGRPGLVVEWTWPAGRRLRAPAVDTGEFRVYLRRGDPNLLSGTVIDVDRQAGRSRLDTDVDWSGPAGALVGQLMRVGGESYPVLDHGGGPGTWFDVAHLGTPLRRPGTGACSITITPGVAFAHAADFDRRVAVVPADPVRPVTTTVTAVRPTRGGAELTFADPVTVDGGGLLLSRGVGYPMATQRHVGAVRQPDGARLLPAVGDEGTVWSDTRYQAWLPGIRLEPGPGEAFAVATVGVAAADSVRQGPTGPARVAAPRRGRPPVLPVSRPDGDIPAVPAEPADWYGRAHYPVALDPVAGVVGYRVLRASTAALFAVDVGLRRTGRDPYASGPFPDDPASVAWLAEHHPTVSIADLTADPATAEVDAVWRDWSGWFYPALSNRRVMELSDLDTHQDAFQPAHVGTVPGPTFRDTMDGRGAGRFLYRVRTVDAAGTAGPPSPTFPVVELRDVTPPKSPTVLSAAGDENSVVLTWRAGTEPDLAGYLIWRSAQAADLADVRRLPVHAEVDAVAGTPSSTWTDPGLAPGGDWYYRLAAVDVAGNVSAPTTVVRARPIDTEPPEPPVWQSAGRVSGAAVALAWQVGEDGVVCMVERRRDRDRIYGAQTGWLTPVDGMRQFAWQDDDPGPGAVTYRIRARDAMGNEQRYRWNPVTVPGEDT